MPVLNCTEFERRLRESVETRRPLDARAFRAHAAGCADCGRLWEEHVLLERALAEWTASASECDLADAVLAQRAFSLSMEADAGSPAPDGRCDRAGERPESSRVDGAPKVQLHVPTRGDGAKRSAGFQTHAVSLLAVAAVLMILLAGPFGPPAVDEGPAIVDSAPTAPVPTADEVAQADVDALVRDAGSAWLGLARGAAGVFSDSIVLIPRPPLPTGDAAPEATLVPQEAAPAGRLGRELEPIGRDVGQAIDFLFQTLSTDAVPTT